MYADQIAEGRKRSVRERLNGERGDDLPRSRSDTGKRQRLDDDKWKHDLFQEQFDPKDLRHKLQKKGAQQNYKRGRDSGVQDLRQKLSGLMHSHPVDADPPKTRGVSGIAGTIKKTLQPNHSASETKRTATTKPTSSKKSSQQKSEFSVGSFLSSLGLEKYQIKFQTEEIDMTALKHMSDDDLRVLGIPMGPRKKIMLALENRT